MKFLFGAGIAALIAALIAMAIASFVALFNLLAFVISLLDSLASTPDWITVHNFWAWVVFLFGGAIVIALVKMVIRILYFLVSLIVAAIARLFTTNLLAITITVTCFFVVVVILALLAGVFLTMEFFNFATDNQEHTDYYTPSNWFAHLFIFLGIGGILVPFGDTDSDKKR